MLPLPTAILGDTSVIAPSSINCVDKYYGDWTLVISYDCGFLVVECTLPWNVWCWVVYYHDWLYSRKGKIEISNSLIFLSFLLS